MNILNPKERFIHRDLSWLAFNERVLEEANDLNNPLLERVKFLAIFVSNLDEFFMVRVAALSRLISVGLNQKDSFGYFPQDLYQEIKSRTGQLNRKLYEIYEGKILKELAKNGVAIKTFEALSNEQRRFVTKFFENTLFPTMTPMAVDQGRPFPVLPSKTMAFAVNLLRKSETHLAIIPIPKVVPRLLKLPSENNETHFILVDEVIRQNLQKLFRGYNIVDYSLFRLLRDSELSVEEDVAPDLLKAIERDVKRRARARVIHLEIEKSCSAELLDAFCQGLDFLKEETVSIGSNLDLSYLYELITAIDKPELSYRSFLPAKIEYENIYDRIHESDFISHVPFQSYYPTVDLIQTAAKDRDVLAIKMTLYRTSEDSAIIRALKEAAKNKKQVTVLVEIKARFEEEKNITWARELEEAGCHVIYGMPGLKIHSKMTLIVRKVEGHIRRYVHLSTGNYNEKTARIYTDIGYFTNNDDFAKDISDVFNVITGYSVPMPWKRIISSPNDLRQYFFDLIQKEIQAQKKHKNGQIFAKMNSLEDPEMIEKLYEASTAGVKVNLIVRGICCLVPGLPGLSENIEVKSIVGRFLEHTRIFIFNNNASPRVFLSSADWMRRNFDRRIELLFEITKDDIKGHLQFLMETYWKDSVKARVLQSDKTYNRVGEGQDKLNSQEFLLKHYGVR